MWVGRASENRAQFRNRQRFDALAVGGKLCRSTHPFRRQRRSTNATTMWVAMNHRRTITKVIPPLLLSVGLALSACTAVPDDGAAASPYVYNGYDNGYDGYPYDPSYGSLGFGFGDFDHFHHGRDFGHGHHEHDFAQHAGHGFARFGGHSLAGNIGRGGHGGHRA